MAEKAIEDGSKAEPSCVDILSDDDKVLALMGYKQVRNINMATLLLRFFFQSRYDPVQEVPKFIRLMLIL